MLCQALSHVSFLWLKFDQKVRFESVGSNFESNLNPCFITVNTILLHINTIDTDSLERFDDFRRRKLALHRGPELLRERAFNSLLL